MTTEVETVNKTQSGKRKVILGVVPLVVIIAALTIYLKGGRYVETDNAYVKADVIPISAEVSGTITHIAIAENEAVKQGVLLFQLDSAAYELALQKARADLAKICTDLSALRTSYQEKQAEIAMAESNHAFAKRELQRQIDLKGKNFVSESTLDDLEHKVENTAQQLTVLKLDLNRIAVSLGGDVNKPMEQHPSYMAAHAELQRAELDLARTNVKAPMDGHVSRIPQVGQYVQSGATTMALVATGKVWIEANFTENDLTHVMPGQDVAVHIDTYPDREWHGKVASLSPATGAEFAIIPPQNATGNWVKIAQRVPVRIAVEVPNDAPVLRSGFSAVVKIDTQYQRSLKALFQ